MHEWLQEYQSDFRAKKITREKEEHYIIKGSTHQEDKAILIMYAPKSF